MSFLDEITEFFDGFAEFATVVQRRLAYFLLLSVGVSSYLAAQLYSSSSSLLWNFVKCGVVFLPALIWLVVWALLGQAKQAPELVADISAGEDESFKELRKHIVGRKPGLLSLVGTIRELRNNEAFESVTDAVGSMTLLANPLFMIVAFIMLVILLIFIVITPLLLLF